MPIVTATEVTRAYGARVVLDRVSVAIEPGERVGLLGANGSGKSTLAKMLAGIEAPDTGTIATRRGLTVSYLEQEPRFAPGVTAYQAVEQALTRWRAAMARYEAIAERVARGDGSADALAKEQSDAAEEVERQGGWDPSHRVRNFLERLGVQSSDAPVDRMSGGERRRVALARILAENPELAVLDEPTNHLDPDTVEWLEDYLVDTFAGAILLVTHDRYVLDRVATRIVEIDRGRATTFEGNYAKYLAIREERAAQEAREEANRQNVLRIERDWLSRQAPARTSKQKARIQRAMELESEARAAQFSKRFEGTATFDAASVRGSKRLLEARSVGKSYEGRALFSSVDLIVQRGERIGVVGPNGAGKTTLARILLGQLAPDHGEVTLAPSAKCKYLDQNRSDLDEDLLVIDAVGDGSDKVQLGDQWMRVESYLDRFMFGADKLRQRVSGLSGGERARLALARMLRGEANVLVLDEPTNDLDLPTLAVLEQMLLDFDGAVIVITHDRAFLDRVATHTIAFDGRGKVTRYAGGYEDYRAQRALEDEREKSAKAEREAAERAQKAAQGGASTDKKRAKSGLSWAEQKELDALPAKIDEAETAVTSAQSVLDDPALYTKGAEGISKANRALADAQKALDALMERWEILETKKG
ncbi:MAG: ATP-binding cassette domain-containing protein [Myxococcales bacterium]|nr:ATP-binding cassette domain-containing protein [Myxococcales bacterium]